MSIPIKTSPAKRLQDFLVASRRFQHGASVAEVVAGVVGLDTAQRADILRAIGELLTQINLARQQIDSTPGLPKDLYTRPLDRLEAALTDVHWKAPWHNVLTNLDPTTLAGLEFAADVLSRASEEVEIDPLAMEAIRKQLDEVLAAVLKEQLDSRLHDLIVRKVQEIRDALLMYQIRGTEGLRETLERTVGAIIVERNSAQADSKSEALSKFLGIVIKLQDIVEKGMRIGKLSAPFLKGLLPGPTDPAA